MISDITGACTVEAREIKQEEMEERSKTERKLTLKRAIDEVAGQINCDEQLKRCKIKVEDGNEEDLSEICANGVLLAVEPSTSHSVTVNCEDGTILTDFGEKISTSKSTNLRHVLVFKGPEMECFIDLVRRNEILWDGSFEEYHTRTNKKKHAWESIAAEMSNDLKQVDEETCRKIWLQLRRSYANEKRQQKQNSGARTTRNCKYRRYFDAMKFLDGIMEEEFARDSFFISEPEGGKSCSNSPAPEPGVSRKDIIDNIRKSGDVRKEISTENDVNTSKVIDTIALLAHQLQGQGNEPPVEVAQSMQLLQPAQLLKPPKTRDVVNAVAPTEQQFYQQLQTCFFMLTPEKQTILQRDIMKFAFRRTNQLMDDTGF
uniref:MADF domain-containing protein n=1 Tax=Elaeophora elaphi TaxID=1147741 RepID=A0A0R3S583_9BILA